MDSTTTSNKAKKRNKKTLISTASTAPEDYAFGPTTSFTAGSTTDEGPPRWFKTFLDTHNLTFRQLKQQNEELLSQILDIDLQSQCRLDDLRSGILETQKEQQATVKRQQRTIEDQQASIDALTS